MEYTYKGIKSSDMGVTVTVSPNMRDAESRMKFMNIDGMDGAIAVHEGFQPFQLTMEIAIEFFEDLEQVRGWMQGEGKFKLSSNPGRYINVHILSAIDYTHLYNGIYTAQVVLDVLDPYWYRDGEDDPHYNRYDEHIGGIRTMDFSKVEGVTLQDTFPIHMFKGGRNLLLDSKGTIDLTKLTWEPFEYDTWEEIGE